MTPRTRIAAVQVAVFVGGGLLAPVIHLATHRANHTHAAGGSAFAIASVRGEAGVGDAEHHRAGVSAEERARHEHQAEPGGHSHPHPHPGHGRDHARHSPPRAPDAAGGPPSEESSPTPGAEAQPLESSHGHGSIAHLGLALLSTAATLALPAPEPAGVLPCAPHPRSGALFQPCFPLPRPPPAAIPS